jgi:purine/pyrimidine-nucleoside phosphorylase
MEKNTNTAVKSWSANETRRHGQAYKTIRQGTMNEFHNVTITKGANIYFDGAVTSRTIKFADGESKTLGIMQPGDYHFSTGKRELMEILSGDVQVQLPGEQQWRRYVSGDSFDVAANSAFDIKVASLTDYCCSFIG